MQRHVLHLPRKQLTDVLRRTLTSKYSNGETLTIQETREKLKLLVGGAQTTWGSSTADSHVAPIATSQDDIPPRTMAHSFRKVIIPLGTNPMLKEKYINFYQGIRFGRILEDLDTFAVDISYAHSHDSAHADMKSPLRVVTALVDRIVLCEQPILPDRDISTQLYKQLNRRLTTYRLLKVVAKMRLEGKYYERKSKMLQVDYLSNDLNA
ncbi:hypothetical protein DPMN_133169 [Dreissena polymorpha]|uniref:Uncharacterized protein n=1 Tax=Dreissena polymorpha TaxID=45954 RepID=A0A9D4JEI6_DREPO|nr:hypothetical protein DPMN_133169 [Dreissena polymorpha]